MFAAGVGIYANDKLFGLEFIPSSSDIVGVFDKSSVVTTVQGEAAVHFIDVGQGDCELICADGVSVLIDCGEAQYSDTVARYIRALGISKLDYVIGTHQHSDHIGGLADLLEKFEVGKLIMPKLSDEVTPTSNWYEELLEVIESRGIEAEYAVEGTEITLGDAVLRIAAPVKSDYDNLNNYSIVCRLTHGGNSFLFTGDIETTAESDIIAAGEYLKSNVLKVAHHGSSSSTSEEFLAAVSPKYAVIEVGEGNSYNHPKAEIVKRLSDTGAEIYTTMKYGSIVFVSDGEELEIHTDKGADESTKEDAA